MHTKFLPLIICAFVAIPIATPALSQDTDQSTVIYDAVYFAQFNPVSLEDMIRNIPGGVSLLSNVGRQNNNRGFGSSDSPVLIDGRRMSGKTNDMSTLLARIQASQVERIELIRNNAEGLDIRNEGIIYNVILRAEAENSSSSFLDVGFNYVSETSVRPEILASHNGTRGALDYAASYAYDTRLRVGKINENVLSADRTPREFRALLNKEYDAEHIFTGNIGYEFENGTRVRLNALYSDSDERKDKLEDQFSVNAGGAPLVLLAVEDGRFPEVETEFEFGGDIEFDVGQLGRLKTLFVVNRTDSQENIAQDTIENGVTDRFFTSFADFDSGETIVRSSMTSTFGEHTLEYGGEAAFNTLDASFSFNSDPLENAIVEEDRYELFVTHSMSLNDKLSLQSALTGEFSTIFQNRDGETNSRSFQFLKPRVELRYDWTQTDQFRFLVERTASQLDLSDFVASRNVADDLINFGNPDLEPETTWTSSIGYERRFADDGGSLEMTLVYERISDHIDKILIGDADSGVGNIGSAERLGFDLDLSTRLGFIGFPSAVLTISYRYRGSDTTDPFTGENRTIHNTTPHFIIFNFRHDIENSNVAYGFNAHRRSGRERQDVSLYEVTDFGSHVSIFAEYNFSANMKARIETNRIYGDSRNLDKTFYVGNIADGVVKRVDFQSIKRNPDYFFSLQSTF
ncbi:MAG: TonB-dependent receptor [Woeseia sp.]|nr:TonB-dependent receptor [Woeseia sp.]